jgi:hypothetical protein
MIMATRERQRGGPGNSCDEQHDSPVFWARTGLPCRSSRAIPESAGSLQPRHRADTRPSTTPLPRVRSARRARGYGLLIHQGQVACICQLAATAIVVPPSGCQALYRPAQEARRARTPWQKRALHDPELGRKHRNIVETSSRPLASN